MTPEARKLILDELTSVLNFYRAQTASHIRTKETLAGQIADIRTNLADVEARHAKKDSDIAASNLKAEEMAVAIAAFEAKFPAGEPGQHEDHQNGEG